MPQAVAYAQIAGLPPEAGLVAAPGALLGLRAAGHLPDAHRERDDGDLRALRGRGRPARGRRRRCASPRCRRRSPSSAAGGARRPPARCGRARIIDFISKPVTTGFLFGLGAHGRDRPAARRSPASSRARATSSRCWPTCSGSWRRRTRRRSPSASAASPPCSRSAGSRRSLPGSLIVLAAAVALSALLDLRAHGVSVVGELPDALPDPALPDVSWGDIGEPAARGLRRDGADHGGRRRRPRAGDRQGRLRGRRQPRARGHRRREPPRRPVVGLHPVRRREPDGRRVVGRRPYAARRPSSPPGSSCSRAPCSRRSSSRCPTRRWPRSSSWPSAASSGSTSCGASPASGAAPSCSRSSRWSACCSSASCPGSSSPRGCRSCW